ncbi:hypothetical protein M422DRAFT_775468 [Sphaerobolus stellatus SS14]|nr:hypothetical protein M422DRAFT_775468 [Sphaerobolus stellatus SS14]
MGLSYPHITGDIALDKAQLIAHFLEVVLYGMEFLLFVTAVYLWLGTERDMQRAVRLCAMLLMFIASTIHVGTSLIRILAGFTGSSTNPVGYFIELWRLSYRLKNIYLIVELVLLDIFIIYQCYIVWDKRRGPIMLPLFILLGYIGFAIGCIRALAKTAQPNELGNNLSTRQKWMVAVLSITLVIKLICLGIAAAGSHIDRAGSTWQIFYHDMIAKGYSNITTNILIGLQSGVLVMLALFITIPVYVVGSNIQDIMLDLLSPLTGISFFLILMFSFLGYIPLDGQPSRRSRIDGMLENHIRFPRIAISIDVEPCQSEPSASPTEADSLRKLV